MEREPGTAPFLGRLHNFTLGAMPSLGLTGAAVTGMKYGVPRLVGGLTRDLFREDADTYYLDLLAYAEPELQTLESPAAWIERLASEALDGGRDLIDSVDPALFQIEGASQRPNKGLKRTRAKHAIKRPATKSRSGRAVKRRPPAK
jgi:hypothetical protein